MAAILVLLGLLLGAPVASVASITTLQWVVIGLNAASTGKDTVKFVKALQKEFNSPQFRAWAAANGDLAIRLRPGEITER